MSTVLEEEHVLVSQGWLLLTDADVCWLDCDQPASCYRASNGRHIVLCLPHARALEDGAYLGDYSAAPLPPDSFATAWPWLPLESAA